MHTGTFVLAAVALVILVLLTLVEYAKMRPRVRIIARKYDKRYTLTITNVGGSPAYGVTIKSNVKMHIDNLTVLHVGEGIATTFDYVASGNEMSNVIKIEIAYNRFLWWGKYTEKETVNFAELADWNILSAPPERELLEGIERALQQIGNKIKCSK